MNNAFKLVQKVSFFAFVLSVLIVTGSCCDNKNTPSNENVEETILNLEREALNHWSQGDPVGFLLHFADDATYFDDIAAFSRLDGLEEIKNYTKSLEGKLPAHKYDLMDTKVQVYGNAAILTLWYQATLEDGTKGTPWKATSVYNLEDGNWKVVHANWSSVKDNQPEKE
ncbi:MAG: nuclear transport factor 2 family protein [Flavobacteriales bacterium]|nr:nuclear transport factor 2 family protein [Flavobacteriales bacterium]